MHLHVLQIITILGIAAVLATAIWLVIIALRREHYTRERFAFAALSGFLGMAVSVLSSLADKETPWAAIGNLARAILKLPAQSPEPPRVADHVLMLLVLGMVALFVVRMYENWGGAISVRQRDKQKYHEPTPLLSEGFYEAKRIIKRDPPLELYAKGPHSAPTMALSAPRDTLAWHLQARDLICLRSPDYEIDREGGWHNEARCWIGSNKQTSEVVAIRCEVEELDRGQVQEFVEYVTRVKLIPARPAGNADFIVAIRNSALSQAESVNGYRIKKETEETLLSGLVNFSDYYSAIVSRVERQTLTDSALTLAQVYTIPSCRDEDGSLHPNLEEYLYAWLSESSQRQLALLGDYGQGKSTTALMVVYRLIKQGLRGGKIPILIELRGKSPRHLTPEELVAVWSLPYHLDPQAVMKLLMAGRAFLILEGFDEMALAGDSETRLSHFRTLWKFAYPGTKVLITGRPNFFLDDVELRAALGIQRSAAAGPYCDALHLEPFTLEQIDSALRSVPRGTRTEILALARKDEKFREIVSRGSLLYVVSQLWERERLSQYAGHINSAFVMDLFIKHSYRRQTQKVSHSPDFMVLNESERKYFMSGIAAYMGALDLPNQISREQFDRAVNALYEVIPETVSSHTEGLPEAAVRPLKERLSDTEDPVQDVSTDVRSSGILIFDQSKTGALRFAHKSFMEFLIASVYGERIGGRFGETPAAIMAATHLSATHLLRHPESLTLSWRNSPYYSG